MRILIASVPIAFALVVSGCATKKYVRTQTDTLNNRVSQIQAQTNEQIASLANKQQTDISRVEEHLTSTDNKLAVVANTAQEASTSAAKANTTASAALQQGETNSVQISAHSAELAKLDAAQTYTLVETGNVTFRSARSNLSSEAKAALDLMLQKATATTRPVIEIVGFTDPVGTKSSNITLSEKRAEAVARYLADKNFPPKDISVIGLGEEQTREQLAAEVQGVNPNASAKEFNSLARRVRIRIYAPGTVTGTVASTDGH